MKSEWEVKVGDEIMLGDTTILLKAVLPEQPVESEGLMAVSPETMPMDLSLNGLGRDRLFEEAGLAQFRKLLKFSYSDATSVDGTKAAICDVLTTVFPNAACVAIVDLLPGCGGTLTLDCIDRESVVSALGQDLGECDQPLFSFHILAQAHAKRGPVLYASEASLPMAESVQKGMMTSCVCLPLWRAGEIAGFLHMYTACGLGDPFTRRDVQLLCLMGDLVSLLIDRAVDAQRRSRWLAVAAAGEAISGLSHDAQNVLNALFKNIVGVEHALPSLSTNVSWQFVRDDLDFLNWLVRDGIRRAKTGQGILHFEDVNLHATVNSVLESCRRFFVEKAYRDHVQLINACVPSLSVFVDENAVRQALLNCVGNSLRSLRSAWGQCAATKGMVAIASCEDPEFPSHYHTLNICDDVGGIPREVVRQLGKPFVAGKNENGLGLGLYLVSEVLGRLGGRLRLATSTQPVGGLPAGTVVSLCLPKTKQVFDDAVEPVRPRIIIVED